MRPLRVVMMIESLEGGGAEGFATALATALDRRRFYVTVCVTRRRGRVPDGLLRDAGIDVIHLERSSRLSVRPWMRLLRHLRRDGTDILHGHMFGSNAWAAVIGRLAGVPVVVATEHSWSYGGRPVRRLVDGYLIGRLATAFVAVSSSDARSMVEVEGVPPHKVRLIETALPRRESQNGNGDRFRREIGAGPDVALIAAVASLTKAKALDVLIRAVAVLTASMPAVRLVIAGDGPQRPALTSLIDDLGIADSVDLIGRRSDVPDILAACDAFALSSDNEGSPLAVIEAMDAGCAIVATEVGGVPDLLGKGRYGLLAPRRDPEALAGALLRVLDDRAFAERLGSSARRYAQSQHTLERAARRWEDLYGELAAGLSSNGAPF
ncbi:MAG TPA: glycosyltransferase [Miltoncostaeaceae bacterium]|nr:glycosyltransferase [Miltoncostaeaceae bacterium]